ncbi:MAG: methyltransferase domain-containing protein [Flavobacteriaceae bacterium]|nr:methyltransferase domain-containing protein [Flavobacteriaceae bacterium]
MQEDNAYILGTDAEELHRLGVQHQVWAEEAQKGWRKAQFRAGQTLLDLGSGPGFCTKEMAYLVGQEGKVIGVDLSPSYIGHLEKIKVLHQLNIEPMLADFNEMSLKDNSLDGMYCRWALAWLNNPKEILQKVHKALKPGGKMVIHEYYDWSSLQMEPHKLALSKAITATFKSFKDSDSQIDIGRELPRIFSEIGMKVTSQRLMTKLATSDTVTWQWPKTFFMSYFPRLIDINYLTSAEVSEALKEINELENTAGASICCPIMMEVIAEKI